MRKLSTAYVSVVVQLRLSARLSLSGCSRLQITQTSSLKDLTDVDYIERVKVSQKNWIGRSTGAEVDFSVKGKEDKLRIYTTRCDTLIRSNIHGCFTRASIFLTSTRTRSATGHDIEAYREQAAKKSRL